MTEAYRHYRRADSESRRMSRSSRKIDYPVPSMWCDCGQMWDGGAIEVDYMPNQPIQTPFQPGKEEMGEEKRGRESRGGGGGSP